MRIFVTILMFMFFTFVPKNYAESAITEDDVESGPFLKGMRLLSATAGRSYDTRYGYVSLIQVNINEYIIDNLAFHYGASFGYANTKQTQNGFCGGPEIGIRWHFARTERWSTYAEGSIATTFYQYPLKAGTPKFNFDLQPGFGATYQFSKNYIGRAGMRWHHLSNARIQGRGKNWGYDGVMFYFGFMQLF